MPKYTKYPELRVKIKDLAQEAGSIRTEERLAKAHHDTDALTRLHLHRTFVVRKAARSCQLAYGLLRERAYKRIENPEATRTTPDYKEIARLIRKYGRGEFAEITEDGIRDWCKGINPRAKLNAAA